MIVGQALAVRAYVLRYLTVSAGGAMLSKLRCIVTIRLVT